MSAAATSTVLDLADLFVVAVVIYLFLRRRDWLVGAGWSTLALLVSLAVAGAVVHRLGAAAGGAGHEPVAAADDRRDDGLPRC